MTLDPESLNAIQARTELAAVDKDIADCRAELLDIEASIMDRVLWWWEMRLKGRILDKRERALRGIQNRN